MSDKNNKPKITNARKKFNEYYEGLNESEIQMEILYYQKLINMKLEKIRNNTSNIVWFLIVIPIICGILIGLFSSI